MRICPSCGKVTGDDTLPFCPSCGANFPPGDHTVQTTPLGEAGGRKVSATKFLVLIVALMVMGAGIMFFARAPADDRDVAGDTLHFKYAWDGHTVRVEYDSVYYREKVVGSSIDRGGTSSGERYETVSGTTYSVEDYVVIDKHIKELEGKLRGIFIDNGGIYDVNQVGYANFLSAFVNKVILYKSDDAVHGQEEYWNYPLQTLVLGKGDCEDTSILLAALFHAAGYKSAVVLVPGHAMAAVSVPVSLGLPLYGFGPDEYYMVETTHDDEFPAEYVGREHPSLSKSVHRIHPMASPPETYV